MSENERQANNICYYVELYRQGNITAEELVIHVTQQHFTIGYSLRSVTAKEMN